MVDLGYIESAYRLGRSVIYDLDDTIFPEIAFLENRYKLICEKLFLNDWEGPFKFLLGEFSSNGRALLFDKFITHFSLSCEVADILCLFRHYENVPDLSLATYPWFQRLSERLNQCYPLLIITDGNKVQQKRKIDELRLVEFFPVIHCIFAVDYGGKPKGEPFRALANMVDLHDPLYIGNSDVDRAFCAECEIEFLDVKHLMT